MSSTILGWYGRANCGDDAFVDAFKILLPGQRLRFHEPTEGPLHLDQGERLILGGGDVIKSYYLDAVDPQQPLWVIGCGLGYESEIHELSKRNVKGAIFRNPSDTQIALAAGLPAIFAPDLCFSIPPVATAPRPPGQRKKLGVILSGHPTSGVEQPSIRETSYFEFFQWELASVLDELIQYFDIHWISFSSDPDAWDETPHYSVRRKMNIRKKQTFWPYTANRPLEQLRLIASMDLIITMKFHGAIFSTIQGVPFVSVGQTRKLQEYCQTYNLTDMLIPPYEFSKARALRAIKAAEETEVPERLLAIASRNREELMTAIAEARIQPPTT